MNCQLHRHTDIQDSTVHTQSNDYYTVAQKLSLSVTADCHLWSHTEPCHIYTEGTLTREKL